MTKRSEILTSETIRELSDRVRFLALFQKTTWPEYLALLAQLYDTIEDRGTKIPYSEALDITERFYFDKGFQAPDQKNFNVITLLVTELGVLREVFDGGNRYVDTTRDGKQLLHWIFELSRNRPQYTGAGAETLLSSLQQLVSDPKELSLEEAVNLHKTSIGLYQNDIERMKIGGVHTSEILNAGISVEELFQRADEEASRLLLAAEDVKLAIESARRDLTQRYLDSRFSAGDAIGFVADYSEELRGRIEYQSYRRAKEIFSHIDGLGALSKGKDLHELVHEIETKGLVARHVLRSSSIFRFPEQFQSTVKNIEEKYSEQLHLLKVQVQYALNGNTRQAREDLMALHGLLLKKKNEAIEYLERHPHEVDDGIPFELGVLETDSFEKAEEIELMGVTENGLGSGDSDYAIIEMIRQSEEATVEKVLKKLQGELDRNGPVVLSEYPITLGLPEYYVLAQVDCFSRSIRSTIIGLADVEFETASDQKFRLVDVTNYRYELI